MRAQVGGGTQRITTECGDLFEILAEEMGLGEVDLHDTPAADWMSGRVFAGPVQIGIDPAELTL